MNSSARHGVARLCAVVAVEIALLAGSGAVAWWGPRIVPDAVGPDQVPITEAAEVSPDPPAAPGAATGTYAWSCGVSHHHDRDNVVRAPGVPGAARHLHDYAGNLAAGAHATDDVLAASATTCDNGDRSVYYWPVLQLGSGGYPADPRTAGRSRPPAAQAPVSVLLTYRGSPTGPVVASPRFLRAVTGDARAATDGATLARPTWTCASAPHRRTGSYPACPPGDRVLRVFDFPSCWDGRRTDSPDHRSHLVFATGTGSCPHGTFAVPRLRIEVAYRLPDGARFAIDTLPEQRGDPSTDHADLVSALPEELMREVVDCLNTGRTCRSRS
ncbi:MAG TPA: DUF1996 domain-containing protein [Micromonospora sp.]